MYFEYRGADSAAACLAEAADPGTEWLLCLADRHANDLPAFLSACRDAAVPVCGAIFPGLIHDARGVDHGFVAVPLPSGSRIALAQLSENSLSWKIAPPELTGTNFSSAFLLVDCLAPNIDGFLEEIYDRFGTRINHVGAGAGYHDLRDAPAIFTGEGLEPAGALLILVPRRATVAIRHGWKRVAGPFVASSTRGNVIRELNWEPAGTFYRAQVAVQNPELADKPVFPDLNSTYPLCIAKEGSEDIFRDPMRISEADEVVVLSAVSENSVMYLAHGDHDSLIQAARQAIEDCEAPHDVEQCFISDCYSRALMLKEDFARELETVRTALSSFTSAEIEGVQALGEIAANGKQKLEFFNKTFVIGLMHRAG